MKVSVLWVLCIVLIGSSSASMLFLDVSSFSEVFSHLGEDNGMVGTSRKLKEYDDPITNNNNNDAKKVNLEDYRPYDPVPSSKASIRPGPIQHGTPLMPFIPKQPSPPGHGHPKLVDSP